MRVRTETKELISEASEPEITGAISFSYPQDGRATLMSEGTLEIDYLTGRVKLPTGGTDELSDNLQNHNLRFVRSLMITTDRTCYLRLDNRDAIPIPPGTLTPLINLQFSNLKIRITAKTYLFIIASVNPGTAIYHGTITLTPKFAKIDVASVGDNTIVSGVTGKKIRVLQYALICAGAVTLTFKSGTTPITGDMAFAANGGISTPYSPVGLIETAAGEDLVLNLSASTSVSGHLVYVEVL